MRDILIIFAVLLALLTLVSALGGSIRPGAQRESYAEEEGEDKKEHEHMTLPNEEVEEMEPDHEDVDTPAAMKTLISQAQNNPAMNIEPFDGGSYASA
jgi:hypothetical protein